MSHTFLEGIHTPLWQFLLRFGFAGAARKGQGNADAPSPPRPPKHPQNLWGTLEELLKNIHGSIWKLPRAQVLPMAWFRHLDT